MNSANIFIIVLGTLTVASSAQVPSNDFAANRQSLNDEFQRDYDIIVEEDDEIELPINDADHNDIDDDFTNVQLIELENVKKGAHETREGAETESASENNYCPNDWIGYNNKCYRAFFTTKTWTSANDYCRGIGSSGSLATSDTSQLNVFIAFHVAGGRGPLWIGLNDLSSEDDFHWVENDEHLHGFSAWRSGQPDNARNEDCVEINYQSESFWNDCDCAVLRYFVCQMDEVDI